ncbi:MAG: prohibitin family protein [Cyanobacteria bacterium]|nr:prohibitin family protein [Cyanobacteriota bacterium]
MFRLERMLAVERDFGMSQPNFNEFVNRMRLVKWGQRGGILAAVLLFIVLAQSVVIVPAGERFVVFNNFSGVEDRSLDEGMNVLIPFVESTTRYDVRTHTYTMSAVSDEGSKSGDDSVSVLTADGQIVKMDISVRYHLMGGDVWKLHKQVGPNFVDKIIRPESRTVARNVVSGYTVTEVYSTKRQAIQTELQMEMDKSFGRYFIVLDEVMIRNVTFSEAFAQAIEQKQVAMQDAERMKYVLQKEESEKRRKIIEAEGEAAAITKRAEALRQNPQLIQYEYVQKLSPAIKAIVTDQKTIMSLGDLWNSGNSPSAPSGNAK